MEIEIRENIDRFSVTLLLIGLLLGGVMGFTATGLQNSGGQQASEQLISFLENRSQSDLQVIDVENAGEFYKVNVKTGGNKLQTYYTNGNGKLFTSSMKSTEMIKQRTKALIQFRNCLATSNVTMYGNLSTKETRRQIQALGGTSVVAPIYRDISNRTHLQQALDAGIQRTPAFLKNGEYIQGVKPLTKIEQFSTCNYPLN